jgi:hypothetical protein
MAEGFIWTTVVAALFVGIVARVTFVMASNARTG